MAVERVPYGRPAAEALRSAIADAKQGEPLAPVTVVVPSNHVGVAARRWLASGQLGSVCDRGVGIAGVTFLTVFRLAELLGAADLAGSGRRPVSTPVIAAALRAVLGEAPGVFGPVAAHPATETALVGAYRELRDLSPAGLELLARRSRRAADVVRIHRRARARLESVWYDEEDLMVAAASRPGSPVESFGPVIVYLPQRLTGHGAMFLRTLPDVRVVAGATGDPRADEEVRRSVELLAGSAAGSPASSTGSGPPRSTMSVSRQSTRLVTTSDADDEVRQCVRAVIGAARSGTPFDRIAVLHPGVEPYPRLLHDHFATAGVPCNGPSALPLTARVFGRAALALLELPAGGFRREDVFAWLTAAPINAPVTAWERISREAGVVAGRGDWSDRLGRYANEQDEVARRAAEAWQAERATDQARWARRLRRFVLDLIDELDVAAREARPWHDRVAWLRGRLDKLGDPSSWPPLEEDAARRVGRALGRLAALDEVEGPVGFDVFARTLRLELEADLGRSGRFGEGVFVGPISMGLGLDLDLVVIVGLAEGSFPSAIVEDSLLPDRERSAVAVDPLDALGSGGARGSAGDRLALAADRIDRQHRWLLAALAGAGQHLVSWPRGDLRHSTERVASRWAVDLLAAIGGAPEEVASFDAGIRRLDFPATAQEHRLRTLLTGAPLVGDQTIARGADMATARRSSRFTRFDGNLAGLGIRAPAVTSASRLERWVGCPFAYLLADLLRVEPIENPEDRLQVAPVVRGELVHTILERFIVEVLDHPPAADEPWSAAQRARAHTIAEEVSADYEARGLTGRAIFWARERRRLHLELDRFLDDDDRYRKAAKVRPVAAELAFGLAGAEQPAVAYELPDGRVLRLRGKADRVDQAEDGTLRVIDYKTGKVDDYKTLGEDNPDADGYKLQLPVYALAARTAMGDPDVAVHAEYLFVSAKGDCRRIGYPVTGETLSRVGGRLSMIVDGVAEGMFVAHPTATSSSPWVQCRWCDPDGLGVADLRRAWEAKRADPALRRYAELVHD